MKIEIISTHHKLPTWVEQAAEHWLKQMMNVYTKHLKPSAKNTAHERMLAESIAIEDHLSKHKNKQIILLDERGKHYTSEQFAQTLGRWQQEYESICLVIGGADGLYPDLKSKYQQHLALSTLTLSHPLAYLMICEQIYRAEKILQGHPYHRV
jgi:23S rRNA (pseudouridine1915-N3)-methyltransferase